MMKRRGKRRYNGRVCSVIAAVSLTLFIFSAAVVIVLNARWLYYLDIHLLDIEAYSGYTAEVIRANYDALIDYCGIWHRSALVLPTLPMSQTGQIHFEECKQIFDAVQIICAASFIVTLICAVRLRGRKRTWLKGAGVLSLAVPAVLGILAALDWNRFFTVFHMIFFRNDYWLFDPAADPVIMILPDTYFLHCAALILILIALGAVSSLRLSALRRRKRPVKMR